MMMMPFCPRVGAAGCSCSPAYVTGDRTASITVTTTVPEVGNLTSEMVDGDLAGVGNAVDVSGGTVNAAGLYWRFDFGVASSVKITEAKWYQDTSATHGTWKWQGSNDASAWTDIGSTFTLGGSTTQTITTLSGNGSGYRYYRLLGVSGTMSGSPSLLEIEFKQCAC